VFLVYLGFLVAIIGARPVRNMITPRKEEQDGGGNRSITGFTVAQQANAG